MFSSSADAILNAWSMARSKASLATLGEDSNSHQESSPSVIYNDLWIKDFSNQCFSNSTHNSQGQRCQMIREFLKNLIARNPLDNRNRIICKNGEELTDSCHWILSDKTYLKWYNHESPKLLMLTGGPGKGKTYLSIFLTKYMESLEKEDKSKMFLYFLCNGERNKQTSILEVIHSLIFQLILKYPQLFESFIATQAFTGQDSILTDKSAMWRIFEKMVMSLKNVQVYCILDGINEYDQDSLAFFTTKIKNTPLLESTHTGAILKILISSRDNNHWRLLAAHDFQNNPACIEKLDLGSFSLKILMQQNVQNFINEKTNQLAIASNFTPQMKQYVTSVLTEQACGTFLWVSNMCQVLKGKHSSKVMETLKLLPKGLSDTYKHMLENIQPSDKIKAKFLFLRVIQLEGRQPTTLFQLAMTTKDLCEGLPSVHLAQLIISINECGNFLEIDQCNEVKFVHPTAKEYILNPAHGFFCVRDTI